MTEKLNAVCKSETRARRGDFCPPLPPSHVKHRQARERQKDHVYEAVNGLQVAANMKGKAGKLKENIDQHRSNDASETRGKRAGLACGTGAGVFPDGPQDDRVLIANWRIR